MLVEVAFKGNRKEFFHWDADDALPSRAPVIVEADRGEDLGYVHAQGEHAEKRLKGVPHAPEEGVTRSVRRLASTDDVHRVEELREQDDVARRKAVERVKANGLVMKLTDAEWRWDRRKLTIYFTAEKRVDFRNLVRELASMFRTRIELKQIGVRDEARRLGGIGRCGREYCSAAWLPDLRPVNLGVARDQRLSLNPTQISGACGRLMCCLRYEHDFYVQQRKRFPKEGRIIETARGEEKVVSNDIFRERVTLRNAEGESRIVPLAELRREWKAAPDRTIEDETPPIPFEGLSDEVLRLQDTSEMPAWLPRTPTGGHEARRALPVRDVEAAARADATAPDPRPRRERDQRRNAGERRLSGERPGARRGDEERGDGGALRDSRERGPDGERRGNRDLRGNRERGPDGEPRGSGERRNDGDRRERAPRTSPEQQTSSGAAGDFGGEAKGAEPESLPQRSDAQAAGDAESQEGQERRRNRRRRGRRGGRRPDADGDASPSTDGADS
ncbi:MAG: hypothetical protein IT361_15005 [Gemmatimonadaceae bacterium]|nr:hypothetical protein [Gemmatimonadaceae bacterium]